MIINDFLRSLSSTEKRNLAKEIKFSESYIRMLASHSSRHASIDLSHKIYASKLNSKLPSDFKLTLEHLKEHRRETIERKSRGVRL